MKETIIIKIHKEDDSYTWGVFNEKDAQYIWTKPNDDPYEMIDDIRDTLANEMYESGWAIARGQK